MTDVAVIGGGLAGLINAILLSRNGLSVVLFEKKSYPFHRVCGEYISNEVVPFLKKNDLYPSELEAAHIDKFILTSTNGNEVDLKLDLGGFGISRYHFDHYLYKKAIEAGVDCRIKAQVENIELVEDHFQVKLSNESKSFKLVIGAFGKRSVLDKRLHRNFINARSPYLGVKYHIKTDFSKDTIALHNFRDGYCGISRVENEIYNLCYLSHRNNLKNRENIKEMEKSVLSKNPFLEEIFANSEFLFDKPVVINEISFANKQPVEKHILMCGDAAGMITPLCGNGMAMAIHSAKLLSDTIILNWQNGNFDRAKIERSYTSLWKNQFSFRLWAGRKIQSLFGSELSSNFAVNLARIKPIAQSLVSLTHGKEF